MNYSVSSMYLLLVHSLSFLYQLNGVVLDGWPFFFFSFSEESILFLGQPSCLGPERASLKSNLIELVAIIWLTKAEETWNPEKGSESKIEHRMQVIERGGHWSGSTEEPNPNHIRQDHFLCLLWVGNMGPFLCKQSEKLRDNWKGAKDNAENLKACWEIQGKEDHFEESQNYKWKKYKQESERSTWSLVLSQSTEVEISSFTSSRMTYWHWFRGWGKGLDWPFQRRSSQKVWGGTSKS